MLTLKKVWLVSLVLVLLLGSCAVPGRVLSSSGDNGVSYELFYVEGMPCMRFNHNETILYQQIDGVTCDWSQWNGKKK